MSELTTVYIAKYALSSGIVENQITPEELTKIQRKKEAGEELIVVRTVNKGFRGYGYFLDTELFLTKADALVKAEAMRVKKLISLEKLKLKLTRLDFSKVN
jgi:hypothetical protein